MVAISVSSGVLLTSVSLLQLAREEFLHHHQATLLEDSVNFVLQIISRTVQQAAPNDTMSLSELSSGALPFDPAQGSVQGLDNVRINRAGKTIIPGINGSDVLIIKLSSVLGEVINCAGFAVPKVSSESADSGWVMFYLAPGPDGEPELYCRYHAQKQWDSQAIVSGVECFQVLFGLDEDGDGLPNQFLSGSAIRQQPPSRAAGDLSPGHRVVVVQVALVLRSASGGSKPVFFPVTDLFGSVYTQINGATDIGTTLCPEGLNTSLRGWVRRRVDVVIFLQHPDSLP